MEQDNAILDAASKGDCQRVKLLIGTGADVNSRDEEEKSVLHHASLNRHAKVIELLAAEGAEVNAQDVYGHSALHYAALHDQLAIAELLIDKGANVDLRNKYGNSVLHCASSLTRYDKVVKLLIEKGADVNSRGNDSALHEAACYGHENIARLLIRNGADVNSKDNKGEGALHVAASNSRDKVAELLIKKGADVNSKSNEGISVLHYAAKRGRNKVVELLIERGADVNSKDNNGESALHYASQNGHDEVAELLIERGASVDSRNSKGVSALHDAAVHGHEKVAELLVKRRADVNLQDNDGKDALHKAFGNNHAQVVELLSFHGAVGDNEKMSSVMDIYGRSVLYFAAKEKRLHHVKYYFQEHYQRNTLSQELIAIRMSDAEVYKTLASSSKISVDHLFSAVKSTNETGLNLVEFICNGLTNSGVNIHQVEDCGISVLGYCCKNGKEHLVKYLFQKCESNLSEFINFGNPCPLWLAASNGHRNIVNVLLERHDIIEGNNAAPDGTTPLTVAIAKEHFHIVEAMVHRGIVPMDLTLLECAKFGKHKYIKSKIRKKSNRSKQFNLQLLKNAVSSGCPKTVETVISSTKFSIVKCARDDMPPIISKRIERMIRKTKKVGSSLLIDMSQRFPSFNDTVEKKPDVHKSTVVVDKDIKPLFLGDFCCINKLGKSEKYYIGSDEDGDFSSCPSTCEKKQNCQIIVDLLAAGRLLEAELNHGGSAMAFLEPKFVLIGSVAEGTRLHRASEVDLTVEFKGLKETPFTIEDKATRIMAPACLKEFHLSETSNVFDYPKFLLHFLMAIEKALINMKDKIPQNLKFSIIYAEDAKSPKQPRNETMFLHCPDCKKLQKNESIYEPQIHCTKCLPAVTHTKLSPCLIFEWNDGSLEKPLVVTMDLVAIFPIRGKSVLELYNLVFKTLIEDNPPGWLDYFNSILKRDIILPEFFLSQSSSTNEIVDVAIKLLNYSQTDNYIIRPAQEMEIQQEFQDIPKLKEVYVYMKALNTLLDVGAKSYFMKKVLLFPEYIAKSRGIKSRLDELIYDALTQPDLIKLFGRRIEFELWKNNIDHNRKSENAEVGCILLKRIEDVERPDG